MNSIDNNLSWLFLQVSYRSKQTMLRLAESFDITLQQLYTLVFMEPGQPRKMSELATVLVCDPSNVTGIIDRLFALNYIERQEKPGDRRVKMVSLTSAGEQLRTRVIAAIAANQPEVFSKLTDSERGQLTAILKGLLETE
jgi:DNA-binding MarR family transcriptional regulator